MTEGVGQERRCSRCGQEICGKLSALEDGMLSGSTPRYVFVKRCSAVDPGPMPTTRCDIIINVS